MDNHSLFLIGLLFGKEIQLEEIVSKLEYVPNGTIKNGTMNVANLVSALLVNSNSQKVSNTNTFKCYMWTDNIFVDI